MPLLEVWTSLFPQSAAAYEALGWANLVSGEGAATSRSLHTALTLNPQSETIHKLLLQLNSR